MRLSKEQKMTLSQDEVDPKWNTNELMLPRVPNHLGNTHMHVHTPTGTQGIGPGVVAISTLFFTHNFD